MRNRNDQMNCVLITAACRPGLAAGTCLAQETTLRVMTFNIRYGSAEDGAKVWEHREATVAKAIGAYGPDDLGTRECLQLQTQFRDKVLPDDGHFGVGQNGNGSSGRMVVLYETEEPAPMDAANFRLSKRPEISGSGGKVFVAGR